MTPTPFGNYNRDPKALTRRGFINHGSTIKVGPNCSPDLTPQFMAVASQLSHSLNSFKGVMQRIV